MTAERKRVLVVEDEPQMTEVLCALLIGKGYAVKCGVSMAEAFEVLHVNGRQHATVLDLRLTDSTMPRTIARIRELKSKGAGKVVVITSLLLSDEWEEMVLLAGADEVIDKMKPYFGERLVASIG